MRATGRRRLDATLLVAGGLAVAGLSAFGGLVSRSEQVDQFWVGAQLHPDGSASIDEVIDYDFGALASDKHGIERKIPGLTADTPIQSSSPDAPGGINSVTPTTVDGQPGVDIRIGDATKTVTGHHRYLLAYDLPTVGQPDLIFNALGDLTEFEIKASEVHVVAPWAFDHPTCVQGQDKHACTVRQVRPGELVADIGSLKAHEGVTLLAGRGAALPDGAPALPAPPASRPADTGAGLALPAAAAGAAALVAAALISRLVRRAGRERVGTGGVTDAAFADGSTSTSEIRIDSHKLADMATTDFAPPEGISAPMGGIVLTEDVRSEHKVAWLLEAAIGGAVDLVEEDGKTVKLIRKAPGDAETETILNTAFHARDEIELGSYDKSFASGWEKVGAHLDDWSKTCDLWDRGADRRRLRVRVLGILAAILGLVGVVAGGVLAADQGTSGVVLVVIAAVLAGGGFAAALRAWELRVRTPKGSGVFLRVESFRRFLHESEASHAEDAANRGLLREYTAWAMAVGEIDHWKKAVGKSTIIPQSAGLNYVLLAPLLISSTSHTSTAPSSSGGGGGGGGFSGGGGGGGVGSW
jgi:hypothetical protein